MKREKTIQQRIIERVARLYRTPATVVYARCRRRIYVDQRIVVSYIFHAWLNMGATEIGRELNKDHASAGYYVKTAKDWLAMPILNRKAVEVIRIIEREFFNYQA